MNCERPWVNIIGVFTLRTNDNSSMKKKNTPPYLEDISHHCPAEGKLIHEVFFSEMT